MNDLPRAQPSDIGLATQHIAALTREAAAFTRPLPGAIHPLYSGAVVIVGHAGHVVAEVASGWSLRYSDGMGTELPPAQQVATSVDTIYDLASITKLFTTIAVLQQVEAGRIDLDATVAGYLPRSAVAGKTAMTIGMLLTHTSGLPARSPQLWRDQRGADTRIGAVLDATPTAEPGRRYQYSDLNLMLAGLIVEQVAGAPLDVLVTAGITEPLDMVDTGFRPNIALRSRIAATEFQAVPPRGMVQGEAHDENAWALGGVAGHAGVFGTARDLARLAQAILDGGSLGGARILQPATVETMLTDANARFPGHAHGLGFELDQPSYMGTLAAPTTAGHTGFTGTSLVIERRSASFVILLSNRVHPSRAWGSANPARRAVSHRLALALAEKG